ncbi:hypothetical protein M9H77_31136 [Catharanthus roseus]|uniref:Uncharacterized protein n=1 Tax=Catharanthus roseus TaxID=4058 RepID=A0ACB9ZZJ8_CATRO|nr:hypothetical protein M9H77_31136 [Catharanthus roseus]
MSEEKQENSKEELDLFSLLFIEHVDHFFFLNSLGTYLERRYFIEFNSPSCATPRVDENDFNVANCVSCLPGVEDRRSMGKELGPILKDLSIILSFNHPSLCYEVSLEEFKSLLDSYAFQVSLIDDTSLVELNVVGFALGFDRNSLQNFYTIISMRGRRHTMEFEGQGESVVLLGLLEVPTTTTFAPLKLFNISSNTIELSCQSFNSMLHRPERLIEFIPVGSLVPA